MHPDHSRLDYSLPDPEQVDYPIPYLRQRVILGSILHQLLVREHADEKAIKSIQDQQRHINQLLVQKIKAQREANGQPEPPPTSIALRAATLRGRTPR